MIGAALLLGNLDGDLQGLIPTGCWAPQTHYVLPSVNTERSIVVSVPVVLVSLHRRSLIKHCENERFRVTYAFDGSSLVGKDSLPSVSPTSNKPFNAGNLHVYPQDS